MEPTELLRLLMAGSGDNPNSLAAKVKQKTRQPQIFKFLEGISKEPRRATLQPIADHYGIPVEAFYDKKLAQKVADSRAATEIEPVADAPPSTTQIDPVQTIRDLAAILTDMEEHTRARAATLLTSMTKDPKGPWADWLIALVGTMVHVTPMAPVNPDRVGNYPPKVIPDNAALQQNVNTGPITGPAQTAAEKPVIEGEELRESESGELGGSKVRSGGRGP